MAFPEYIAYGNGGAGTGDVTYPLPDQGGTRAPGDLLLLFIETANEPVTAPAGWSIAFELGTGTAGASDATRLTILSRVAQLGDVDPTVTDVGDHQEGHAVAFRGTNGLTIGNTASDVLTSPSGTITCPGIATTGPDRMILLLATTPQDTSSWPGDSGWTNANLTDYTGGNGLNLIGHMTDDGNGGAFAGIVKKRAVQTADIGPTTSTFAGTNDRQVRATFEIYETPDNQDMTPAPATAAATGVTPTLSPGPMTIAPAPAAATASAVTPSLQPSGSATLAPAPATAAAIGITPTLSPGPGSASLTTAPATAAATGVTPTFTTSNQLRPAPATASASVPTPFLVASGGPRPSSSRLRGAIASLATGDYVVTRRLAGTYVDGLYVPDPTDAEQFVIVASVQPVTGRDLKDLPEGQNGDEVYEVITTTPIHTRIPGFEADEVSIDGEPWKITRASTWRSFGDVHYETIATRLRRGETV